MERKMKIHREALAPTWEVTCEECSRISGARTIYLFDTWEDAVAYTAKHRCDKAEEQRGHSFTHLTDR